jgi:fumarate hydratase class I
MPGYTYTETYQVDTDTTPYRLLTTDYVSQTEFEGKPILKVDPEGLTLLARTAFDDVAFYLRPTHLQKLKNGLADPEASDNDRFVLYTLLQNACVAAGRVLPSCQDTGTAIVMGKKGQQVWTGGNDAEALSQGIYQTYRDRNLRYSQIAPLAMFEEKNTGNNLPAQIDLYSTGGNTYSFLFVAKGGGSANKTYLYQQTKSLLTDENLETFVTRKLGEIARNSGIGAQFGGKYFAHDVRVIRLPRHAASCPVGLGVSCSADRNIKGKITPEGIFLEQLEFRPEAYLPAVAPELAPAVNLDLDQPMDTIREILGRFPIKTRLNLSGTLIVARDIAHARIKEMLDNGESMPKYFKNHPIYYAGPAKTPEGMPSGSFGPTTAGRMDPYVNLFQSHGGSLVMLAKGNRSQAVTDACKRYGGFYLGSIGGPAAILARDNIKHVEVVAFPELGMEAIRKIEVVNFPAFIIADDKGNDFFQAL